MKKIYTKPYIATESFQLDAAIASSCSSENKLALHFGLENCTAEEEAPGLNYFGLACIHNVDAYDDDYDEICYHGPIIEASTMFMNS